MTSVRKNGATPPQRPAIEPTMAEVEARFTAAREAGRAKRAATVKCGACRKKVTQTPGKVAKTYCDAKCRVRASRASVSKPKDVTGWSGVSGGKTAGQTADGRPESAPKTVEPFSTTGEETVRRRSEAVFPPRGRACRDGSDEPSEADVELSVRAAIYRRRDAHQTVANGRGFLGCGKRLIPGSFKAELRLGDGKAAWGEILYCGSVHLCVSCAGTILGNRAEEAQLAADALAGAGYGLALGAHVLRHFARTPYGSLRKEDRGGLVAVLHDAWTHVYGSAGRPWRTLRDSYGLVGYERSFEDTWGEASGFHLHFHPLYVFREKLTAERCAEFEREVSARWIDGVQKAGGYKVSDKYGTKVRLLGAGTEGQEARYLYKDGDKDGPGTAGFGMEFVRTDLKSGQKAGRLAPFQLADAAAVAFAEGDMESLFIRKFREREYGVHGVKKRRRTPSLMKILRELDVPLDMRKEQEIAAAEAEGKVAIALFPRATWYGKIARYPGRREGLLDAAERGGVDAVRELIESWGLKWGWDVQPVTPAGDVEPGDPSLLDAMSKRDAAGEALAGWITQRGEGALFSPAAVA